MDLHYYVRTYDDTLPMSAVGTIQGWFASKPRITQIVPEHRRFEESEVHPGAREDSVVFEMACTAIAKAIARYRADVDVTRVWPAKIALENFRVKLYRRESGHFNRHVDVLDYASARRYLTAIWYLTDAIQMDETRNDN